MNKVFKDKQDKLNLKKDKREARKIKKIKKKQVKSILVQTESHIISISTQTEPLLQKVPRDFAIIKNSIQNSIDKFLAPNFNEISIQCNLERPVERQIPKTNTLSVDFYLLNFFRKLDRDNAKIKSILHINEDEPKKYRREMFGVFDTQDEIYNMKFEGQYCGDIRLKFYSDREELFFINYTNNQKCSNMLGVHSRKYKNILAQKKINMQFRHFYKIEIKGSDGKYIIFFNGNEILTIKIDAKIQCFASNSNFKVSYT